ncbi:TPA: hypothetical protein JBD67_17035, partial [Legionella pneumophila subsp. pneumophila]|nr:hypothetical protein [Legionella pneumophila subsp. pneumophila]
PSEKSRYLNRGPKSPVDMHQLKKYLNSFTKEHLAEIVLLNAQYNSVLWRALSASIGMRLANGDWEEIKKAIDYAFYFPEYIRYTENGYGFIIYEMINALEFLYKDRDKQFILQVADYMFEQAEQALESFEEGWDWTCALESLKDWIRNKKIKCK